MKENRITIPGKKKPTGKEKKKKPSNL